MNVFQMTNGVDPNFLCLVIALPSAGLDKAGNARLSKEAVQKLI